MSSTDPSDSTDDDGLEKDPSSSSQHTRPEITNLEQDETMMERTSTHAPILSPLTPDDEEPTNDDHAGATFPTSTNSSQTRAVNNTSSAKSSPESGFYSATDASNYRDSSSSSSGEILEESYLTTSENSEEGDDTTSNIFEDSFENEPGAGRNTEGARVASLVSGTWEGDHYYDNDFDNDDEGTNEPCLEVFADEDDFLPREQPEPAIYEPVLYKRETGRLELTVEQLQFYPSDNNRLDKPTLELMWFNVVKHEVSPKSFAVPMLRVIDILGNAFIFQLPDEEIADMLREDLKDYPTVEDSPSSKMDSSKEDDVDSPLAGPDMPRKRLFDIEEKDSNENDEKMPLVAAQIPGRALPPSLQELEGEKWQEEDEYQEEDNDKDITIPVEINGKDSGSDDWDPEAAYAQAEKDKRRQEERQRRQRRQAIWIFLMFCCPSVLILLFLGGIVGYYIGAKSVDNPNATMVPVDTRSPSFSMTPSVVPSSMPSTQPTINPSPQPSVLPSHLPSLEPTSEPSEFPSSISFFPLSPAPTSNFSTEVPTLTPTASLNSTQQPTTGLSLLEILSRASFDGGAALKTAGTPQQQAYLWMAVLDQLVDGLPIPKKIQRYALATFYYSTGGQQGWSELAQPPERSNDSWMNSTIDECNWGYVVCNSYGDIVALNMMYPDMPRLIGSLPAELGLLSLMTQLGIAGEEMQAAASRNVLLSWRMENTTDEKLGVQLLGDFNINSTAPMIAGSIPSEVGALAALETFGISNMGITGALPSEVANMNSIRLLDLTNNQLEGSIPSELGTLSLLTELRLGSNIFTGHLNPSLFVAANGLSRSLSGLHLFDNKLEGAIPSEIGLLTAMKSFYLEDNNFVGQLATQLGNLSNMEFFHVQNNHLTGEVPSFNWFAVEEFRVDGNDFSGLIPADLCGVFLAQKTKAYTDCQMLKCSCCNYCCVNNTCSPKSSVEQSSSNNSSRN